jgi:hypothetical protein
VPTQSVGFYWVVACLALQEFGREYAFYGDFVEPGSSPLVQPMAWLLSWVYVPGLSMLLVFLPLYFPDGRLPSPRWKRVALSAVVLTVAEAVKSALLPGEIMNSNIVNPLGNGRLQPVFDLLVAPTAVAKFQIVTHVLQPG